jgi:predicted ATPase with chaperone activity
MPAETAPSIAVLEPEVSGSAAPFVAQPSTVEDTGLDLSILVDLALKTIHFAGRPSGRQLADQMALSFSIVENLLAFLRQNQAIETVGSSGLGEQAYQYALTEQGRQKAEEALRRSQYVGPAPVPFSLYAEVLQQQAVSSIRIERDTFLTGLSHLVLSRRVLAALGPAVNCGRSVLIYGAAGNGKTSIASAIGSMLSGEVLIPYAVEVHGQIIKVFDPRLHQRTESDYNGNDRRKDGSRNAKVGAERRRDRRWAIAKRPFVSVGGELTLQDLELRYSPISQFYIAPLQWKANSGLLVIDDFGRQLIQPQQLLNRWIVPMEEGVDHLSMHTGDTVELPFDVLLVFSSNIPPSRLGDEAFFRRIRHKVEIPNPTPDDFLEILRRVCAERDVEYSEEGARHLLSFHYERQGRDYKACHPRDLVELLMDMTRFYGEEPKLTAEWLDLACPSYFVKLEDEEL